MSQIEIKSPEELTAPHCSLEERETTINLVAQESKASIYTCDPTMVTKIKRVWSKNLEAFQTFAHLSGAGLVTGYTFLTSKRTIAFRNPKRRTISEEGRLKVAERFEKFRKRKKEILSEIPKNSI